MWFGCRIEIEKWKENKICLRRGQGPNLNKNVIKIILDFNTNEVLQGIYFLYSLQINLTNKHTQWPYYS